MSMILCFLITLILNFRLAIPGVALLLLRIFIPVIPLWLPLSLLALWILEPILITLILGLIQKVVGDNDSPRMAERAAEQAEKHRKSQEILQRFQEKR